MELPAHPGADDTAPDDEPAAAGGRAISLGLAVLAALVVVMMVLHLTGVVGPRAH